MVLGGQNHKYGGTRESVWENSTPIKDMQRGGTRFKRKHASLRVITSHTAHTHITRHSDMPRRNQSSSFCET